MIILTLYILSKVKNTARVMATVLSFLVTIQTAGAADLIEKTETSNLEEEVKIEYASYDLKAVEDKHYSTICIYDFPTTDTYHFSIVEKDNSPSSSKIKLYILYLQLAYDKYPMISLV